LKLVTLKRMKLIKIVIFSLHEFNFNDANIMVLHLLTFQMPIYILEFYN